jgi:biopolymer transport protein ExbB/TolQ
MPGWRLRIWLAVTILAALTMLPLSIAGVALWIVSVRYMMLTETAAHDLREYRRATRRLKLNLDETAALVAERDTQIAALEADLTKACSNPSAHRESDTEKMYRQVGLHPRAPAFLITAARRAYRLALHPDKHPRHREEAHSRFLAAEAAFEEIAELRR